MTPLETLVVTARIRAMRGTYDGTVNERNMALIKHCSHRWLINPELVATIFYTRDTGHHTSGWWKNPDYERCLHLSVGYRDPKTMAVLPHESARSKVIAEAFFGENTRLTWIEGPYSAEGRLADIWHYRIFCDPAWVPMIPKGEVYSKDWTPADWRSFSDVHNTPLTDVDAPFILGASQ
jgi:hypothetical protein